MPLLDTLSPELIDKFEAAWSANAPTPLEQILESVAVDMRRPLLVELIPIEMSWRLESGEAIRIESYFERFPELTGDAAAAIELILREFDLRRRTERDLSTADYL